MKQTADKYIEQSIEVALATFLSEFNRNMKPSEVLEDMQENPSTKSPNYLLWREVEHLGVRHTASTIHLLANNIQELVQQIVKELV